MQTVYQIKGDELNIKLIKSIKELFGNKELRITVNDSLDETEYLLSSPQNTKRLLQSIENLNKKENVIELTFEQLRDFVNEKTHN